MESTGLLIFVNFVWTSVFTCPVSQDRNRIPWLLRVAEDSTFCITNHYLVLKLISQKIGTW